MNIISTNITYKEGTKSNEAIRLGLSNDPNPEQLANMKLVAEKIFQPLREHFNVSIGISSFFRSPEVNQAIGGAKASQHMTGQAIDIDADIFDSKLKDGTILTNKMIFDYIVKNLDYDTIIWEFGDESNPAWVHVSYVKGNNRKRKLRAYKDNKRKTQYAIY